jgi:hypothetical protein
VNPRAITLLRRAAPLVPSALKGPLRRAFGEVARTQVMRRLAVLAEGQAPIVAGPWLGEVGFELLYWVPFLNWFAEEFGIAPERIIAMSRGGTRDWYRGVAARYRDAFDQISTEEFRERNAGRAAELGEQKQIAETQFERDLLAPVLAADGISDGHVLYPSMMYTLMRPYWWGHAGIDWVDRHTRYRTFGPPSPVAALESLPATYAAVKFYYSESFPPTSANRAVAQDVVARLRDEGPVVSLSTGLDLDDHQSWEDEEDLAAHGIPASLSPADNLALQSAVVGRARVWAGTYGGFAYLAPFYGVRAEALFSVPGGFSERHLSLARHVFARLSDNELLRVSRAA